MPCWVVPTLAAEIWGVSLDHVLEQMSCGAIASKVDYGFVLVDIAPGGPQIASAPPEPVSPPPPTFIPVADGMSDAELAALSIADAVTPAPSLVEASAEELLALGELPAPVVTAVKSDESAASRSLQRRRRMGKPLLSQREVTRPSAINDEHEDGPDPNYGEVDDGKPLDWRATRARVAMTRRRPPSVPPAPPAFQAAVA